MTDAEKFQLVGEWYKAKRDLAEAQARERMLRERVVADLFEYGEGELREKTERFGMPGGYSLKATFSIRHGFSSREDVRAALDEIETMGDLGRELAERLVRWTPELSLSEYKKAPDAMRDILARVVVAKPALPSLELDPPKAKK